MAFIIATPSKTANEKTKRVRMDIEPNMGPGLLGYLNDNSAAIHDLRADCQHTNQATTETV